MTGNSEYGHPLEHLTRDMGRAVRMAEELETRRLNMNDVCAHWQVHGPLGSHNCDGGGVGHLGGKCAIMKMSGLKTVVLVARATQ